ncbi:hypothetical protein PS934_05929 [Pseudomonas fluorescens]|nr:hypothetical protein PS934_05929 [Pseudomonas fluorescens]
MRRGIISKADVRTVLGNFVQYVVDRKDVQPDIELRVLFAEGGEHVVDQGIDIALTDDDAHLALLQALDRLELVFELFLV